MLSGRKDKKELLETLRRKKDSKASTNYVHLLAVGKSIFIKCQITKMRMRVVMRQYCGWG